MMEREKGKTYIQPKELHISEFTWDSELKWDDTTLNVVVFFKESNEAIILCNAKVMGPKSLCGIY